jgi:hypothetical protein
LWTILLDNLPEMCLQSCNLLRNAYLIFGFEEGHSTSFLKIQEHRIIHATGGALVFYITFSIPELLKGWSLRHEIVHIFPRHLESVPLGIGVDSFIDVSREVIVFQEQVKRQFLSFFWRWRCNGLRI